MPLLFAAIATILYWTAIIYYRGRTRKVVTMAYYLFVLQAQFDKTQLKHIPSITSDLPLLSYLGTFQFLTNTKDMINKGVKQVTISK